MQSCVFYLYFYCGRTTEMKRLTIKILLFLFCIGLLFSFAKADDSSPSYDEEYNYLMALVKKHRIKKIIESGGSDSGKNGCLYTDSCRKWNMPASIEYSFDKNGLLVSYKWICNGNIINNLDFIYTDSNKFLKTINVLTSSDYKGVNDPKSHIPTMLRHIKFASRKSIIEYNTDSLVTAVLKYKDTKRKKLVASRRYRYEFY